MSTVQRAPDVFAPCAQFEAFARTWFHARAGLAPSLAQAVEYSFFSGGKRLRPMLVYWTHVAMGGRGGAMSSGTHEDEWPQRAGLAGLAVELIHCFSLVHDDLPALDNDDVRRGKPTLHRHCGEAMAILAGDAMTSLAFEALASMGGGREDAQRNLELQEGAGLHQGERASTACVRELARATTDMITGQVYDTFGVEVGGLDPKLSDLGKVEIIHANKTGALIRAACIMGAWSAGATPSAAVLGCVARYADALGLIFQITDDIIDVTQPAEHAGKATGKDAAMGKVTYPGVMGIEASQREVQRLVRVAQDALAELSEATNVSSADVRGEDPHAAASRGVGRAALDSLCVQMAMRTK